MTTLKYAQEELDAQEELGERLLREQQQHLDEPWQEPEDDMVPFFLSTIDTPDSDDMVPGNARGDWRNPICIEDEDPICFICLAPQNDGMFCNQWQPCCRAACHRSCFEPWKATQERQFSSVKCPCCSYINIE